MCAASITEALAVVSKGKSRWEPGPIFHTFDARDDAPGKRIDGDGMRKSRIAAIAVAASFAAVGSSAAQAQALDDDYWVKLSAYFAKIDTQVRVDADAVPGSGTTIDLEDDLGFDDDEILPALYAGARLGGGFSVVGEYFSLSRDTTHTLSRNITVEDVTYPVNARVTAGFDTNVYRFVVGWAFVRQPNLEVGAAIGVHATDIGLSIEGEGSVGGSGVTVQQRREDFLAPLPTVGLFGSFEPIEGVTLGGRIDYLSLSVGDYDGRLVNAQASVAYRFTRHLGIGAMYRYVDYRVDVTKTNVSGRFAYSFSGPSLFLEAGF